MIVFRACEELKVAVAFIAAACKDEEVGRAQLFEIYKKNYFINQISNVNKFTMRSQPALQIAQC